MCARGGVELVLQGERTFTPAQAETASFFDRFKLRPVALAENIIKYKQFVYTGFTALIDNLLTCFRGAMDKRK